MSQSVDYIFRPSWSGLEFVGNFNEYYKNDEDPWAQSASEPGAMSTYYNNSRAQLLKLIWLRTRCKAGSTLVQPMRGLEVGCGHGHVTNLLARDGGTRMTWLGIDISEAALHKARTFYPEQRFICHNILDPVPQTWFQNFDVIVLGQMLWYIMHDLDRAIKTVHFMLKEETGLLVISQAFLKREQRYGKDIFNGFSDAVRVLLNRYDNLFELVEARFEESDDWAHNDGLIMFRVRK